MRRIDVKEMGVTVAEGALWHVYSPRINYPDPAVMHQLVTGWLAVSTPIPIPLPNRKHEYCTTPAMLQRRI